MSAWWTNKLLPNSFTDHISAFWDVMPTFADIIDKELLDDIDGISFLPTLMGKNDQKQHKYLYWEFHEKKGRVAIRKGLWKGVRYNVSINENSPLELYDLSNDIGEDKNIASQYPDVVNELNNLLLEARTVSSNKRFNFPNSGKKK